MSATLSSDFAMGEVNFGTDLLPDLPERLTRLRREGNDVVRVRYHGGSAYLVLGYNNIAKAFSDDVQLPCAAVWTREFDTAGKTLLHMRGEEHRKLRMAFTPALSPKAVRGMVENILIPTADELIDDFGSDREVELDERYCRRYTFNVVSRALGVLVSRQEEAELRQLVSNLVQHKDWQENVPADMRRARSLRAVDMVNDRLRPVIEARRKDPRNDLISFILGIEIDGKKLTDDELFTHIRMIYQGGVDSTAMMLGNMMLTVLLRPELQADLLAHPEKRPGAIGEATRMFAVSGLIPRYTERDVVIGGVTIPANNYVLMGIPGANRDQDRFPNADALEIDRKTNLTLTFGQGPHSCLGIYLAREELRVTMDKLLDRLPGLRLADDPGPIVNGLMRSTPHLRVRFDDILPAK